MSTRPGLGRLRQPWRWIPFRLRLRLASLRAVAVRRRVLRRTLVLTLLASATLVWASSWGRARDAQDRWGPHHPVVVAASDLSVGSNLVSADLEVRDLPRSLVVDDALTRLPHGDRTLVIGARTGEVITNRHLAGSDGSGLVVADGTRAVAIAMDDSTPPIGVGDPIDLVLISDPFDGSNHVSERSVEAIVLRVEPDAVTVAVDQDLVTLVARTIVSGHIVITRR
ncbi:MAG: hypothetical protein ACR2P0_10990 [Acidimicrobiales bacterium]